MCADKVVRLIKKCLRGEESTTSAVLSSSPAQENDCSVQELWSEGSSPVQTPKRNRWASGRTERRRRRGLPDILQSQNICSISTSSFAKDKYGPLLDLSPHETLQSQSNIYSDTKGRGLSHELPCRTHPKTHLRQQLQTNQQHLPYHQMASPSPASSQAFSQKHLHHNFPPSVRRSMDGEESYRIKQSSGVLSRDAGGVTGPPPNRTIFS